MLGKRKIKSYGLDTYLANEERHVKVIVWIIQWNRKKQTSSNVHSNHLLHMKHVFFVI